MASASALLFPQHTYFPLNAMNRQRDQRFAITVANHVGFGILVDKSAVVAGVQKFLKREHAKMLAFKSVGHLLPLELVDEVAAHLYDDTKQKVSHNWRSSFALTLSALELLGGLDRPCSEAWQALADTMNELGLRITFLNLSQGSRHNPVGDIALIWQKEKIPKTRLCRFESGKLEGFNETSMSYKGQRDVFLTKDGITAVNCSSTTISALEGLSTQFVHWKPRGRHIARPLGRTPRTPTVDAVEHVIQFKDLITSAAYWDFDAAEKFAGLLELDVPLVPGLVMYQRLTDAPLVQKTAWVFNRRQLGGIFLAECFLLLALSWVVATWPRSVLISETGEIAA